MGKEEENRPILGTPEYFAYFLKPLMEDHELTPDTWAQRVGMDTSRMREIAEGRSLPLREELVNLGRVLEYYPIDRADMFMAADQVPLYEDVIESYRRVTSITPEGWANISRSLRPGFREHMQIGLKVISIKIKDLVEKFQRKF